MKKIKFDSVVSLSRHRCLQFVIGFAVVYCCFMTSQIPFLSRSLSSENHKQETQIRFSNPNQPQNPRILSNLVFKEDISGYSSIYRSAVQAWEVGSKLWEAVVLTTAQQKQNLNSETHRPEEQTTSCPHSITLSGDRFYRLNRTLALPCGMMLGSHVTVVGKPRAVHLDSVSVMSGGGRLTKKVNVSQFMFELRKGNDKVGEEPPRILHFNPRIEGDWSGRPVIEMNACYRGQWGTALRCEGWRTTPDEETVDGQVRCEEWVRDYDDDKHLKELRSSWWSNRLARGTKEVATIEWSFPFAENKYFVLTVSAGLEGFHVSVDGRHVASFPYRTGFELEDSANAYLYGDIDVHSVYAASLPTSHPSFAPHRRLDMSAEWQAPPVPDGPVDLFIGILSAADHFTERMAVRKSWMQHYLVRSSRLVPRFFVALHRREMINVELKKEAEFFGDIIIVPYLDNYDLVVLKTAAICEYGVNAVAANYILKCDDDTFVRLDAVIQVAEKAGGGGQSFYLGKMNYYHRPLRVGKWAVGFEEWPEKLYPPYADGPGYIISADIARFVVSELERNSLRLFKMEDVSMGMWVEQFNKIIPVDYIHDALFVQHGCVDGYYTAHYQSPKQMICLWDRLQNEGLAKCCNLR